MTYKKAGMKFRVQYFFIYYQLPRPVYNSLSWHEKLRFKMLFKFLPLSHMAIVDQTVEKPKRKYTKRKATKKAKV